MGNEKKPPRDSPIIDPSASLRVLDVVGLDNYVLFPQSYVDFELAPHANDVDVIKRLTALWEKRDTTAPLFFMTTISFGGIKKDDPKGSYSSFGVIAEICDMRSGREDSSADAPVTFRIRAHGRGFVYEFLGKRFPHRAEVAILIDDPSIDLSDSHDTNAITYEETCVAIADVFMELAAYFPDDESKLLAIERYERIHEAIATAKRKSGNILSVEKVLYSEELVPYDNPSLLVPGLYPLLLAVVEAMGSTFEYDFLILAAQVLLSEKDPVVRTHHVLDAFRFVRDSLRDAHADRSGAERRRSIPVHSREGGDESRSVPVLYESDGDHVEERVPPREFMFVRIKEGVRRAHEESRIDPIRKIRIRRNKHAALDTEILSDTTRDFEVLLRHGLKGQPIAVRRFLRAFERIEAGFTHPSRPLYTVLNLGPSGSGKTQIAKLLADAVFGDPNGITMVECVKYVDRHQVAELIGSPGGYIGYEDVPLLAQVRIDQPHYFAMTAKKNKELQPLIQEMRSLGEDIRKMQDAIRKRDGKTTSEEERQLGEQINRYKNIGRTLSEEGVVYNPADGYYSVIVFDEIEKAHSSLINFVLTILSEGKLKMNNPNFGVTDFTRSIIVFTSNIARDEISGITTGKKRIGFATDEKKIEEVSREIYLAAKSEAERALPPEFRGRIDDMIVFRPLGKDAISEIFDLEMRRFHRVLKEREINLSIYIDPALKEFIVCESLDNPELGARLLQAKLAKYLDTTLARLKNTGQIDTGDELHVKLKNHKDFDPQEPNDFSPEIVFYKKNKKTGESVALEDTSSTP